MSRPCGLDLCRFDPDLIASPRLLFVSPWRPLHSLSKNSLSFFLRQVILDAGAVDVGTSLPRIHSVRAVAASAAFMRNWSVFKVLEAVIWKSNPVFDSFYLCDLSYSLDSCHSLGPFVAAGSVFH